MTRLLEAVDVLRGQLDALNGGEMPVDGPVELVDALKAIASGNAGGEAADAASAPADAAATTDGGEPLKLSAAKLDLVEFMITDLRDQLTEIESLAVALVEDASSNSTSWSRTSVRWLSRPLRPQPWTRRSARRLASALARSST